MGMGMRGDSPATASTTRKGGGCTNSGWKALLLATILAMVLAQLPSTARGFELTCPGELQYCMDLFHAAQDTLLGIQDFHAPTVESLTPEEHHSHCIARRTIVMCLKNLTRQCKGDLQYHTAKQGMAKQMKQLNCSAQGPVFDPSTITEPSQRPPCTFQASQGHRHCGMFGQPHLRTFSDEKVTCRIQGAWPLIDNKYLTVQVTNEPMGSLTNPKTTATTSLTVMIKKEERCGAHHFVTYQAQSSDLPSTFDDGRTHFGREHAVRLAVEEANRHVEIHIRYIDTTVVIRRTGNYLNFAIRMPAEIVQDSLADNPNGIELCAKSCPGQEQIDVGQYLAQKHGRLKGSSGETTSAPRVSREVAVERCQNSNVLGFYFDSCVFDLMSTGDSNFSLAAHGAQQDSGRLYPQTRTTVENRTSLDKYDRLYGSGAARTFCFLRTACVLLLSQLVLHVNGWRLDWR